MACKSMMGYRKDEWRNPLIRRHRNGKPNPEIVQPLNRSDAIRRIFHEFGINTPIRKVVNHLHSQGIRVPTDALIQNVRNQMKSKLLTKQQQLCTKIATTARKLLKLTGSITAATKALKAA